MRKLASVILNLAVLAAAFGAGTGPPPIPCDSPESPYAPIAFLAGGTWRGHLPPAPNGKRIDLELKAEWAPNRQGLRFDGTWIVDGSKRVPYTSGIYGWNAAKKQLVLMYSDAEGGLIDGTVTLEKGVLVHSLTVSERSGNVSSARSRITPGPADVFTNEISVLKNGEWKKLVEVRYERQK